MGKRCEMHNRMGAVQVRHPINIRSDIRDLNGLCALKLDRLAHNGSNIMSAPDRRGHQMPTKEPRCTGYD
jgi:hypothetical protein